MFTEKGTVQRTSWRAWV
ncbi:hypothetical protein LINPERHAP1_LOCUS22416 [Linum perenne]